HSMVRGRPTEVEYLNGEIVMLGKTLQVPTPANAFVVALMERVTSERRHLTRREIDEAWRESTSRQAALDTSDRDADV
ncbi:MAG: ketopantoate reductase family protein, partial [Burkholderiales bacterium]